jgi:hypothetical protein
MAYPWRCFVNGVMMEQVSDYLGTVAEAIDPVPDSVLGFLPLLVNLRIALF